MGSLDTSEPPASGLETIPGAEPRRRDDALGVGARVGRYVIVSVLGTGGMGVVYGAFDPDLDRKIALKLLHRSGSSARQDDTSTRLLREAQAAARVQHPNVITVHDVGQHGGDVFVAMEFVEGETLRDWMQRPHGWREIVTVLRAAGEGVAAAHAQGLVHRDFKPDNVLIGVDGRVVVTDFGLARAEHSRRIDAAPDSSLVDAALTQTGAVLGTPAYMAPEQHLGHDIDARADQFSFCVTLYEALYGTRPFSGDSLASLSMNVTAGKIDSTPSSTDVPRWLRSTLAIGLARDPADRHPDMRALLDALARDPTRRWRWIGALAAVGAIAAGALAVDAYTERQRLAACDAEGEAAFAIWNDERKDALRSTFLATDPVAGAEGWSHTEPVLDAYADAWAQTREDICVATEDRAPDQLACIEARLAALRKLTDGLDAVDANAMHMAVRAASHLPSPVLCLDPRVTDDYAVEPDTAAREIGSEVAELVEEANVARNLGRFDDSLLAAERAVERAEAIDRPRPLASAWNARGYALEALARLDDAEVDFERAHFLAREHGFDSVAIRSATRLVTLVGERLRRHDEGLRWSRHARALILQRGGRGSLDWAALLVAIANVEGSREDYAAAREAAEEAVRIYREQIGDRNPMTAAALNDLAIVQSLGGDKNAAQVSLREAIEVRTHVFGERHPSVAESHENLGNVLFEIDDEEGALHHYERALEIRRATLGENHLAYARTAYNLGNAYGITGRAEAGLALLRHALRVREQTLPAGHLDLALTHLAIGSTLASAERYPESREELDRAVELLEASVGTEHDYVRMARDELATVQAQLDRSTEPTTRDSAASP